jgi:hypothetical protein
MASGDPYSNLALCSTTCDLTLLAREVWRVDETAYQVEIDLKVFSGSKLFPTHEGANIGYGPVA